MERVMEIFEGEMDFFREMLGRFLDVVPKRLGELAEAEAEGDQKAVEVSAHSIKGLAMSIGAGALAEIARHIEEDAAEGHDMDTKRLIDDIQAELGRIAGFAKNL